MRLSDTWKRRIAYGLIVLAFFTGLYAIRMEQVHACHARNVLRAGIVLFVTDLVSDAEVRAHATLASPTATPADKLTATSSLHQIELTLDALRARIPVESC